METKIHIRFIIFFTFLFISACSSNLHIYEYNFIYKGKSYVIRSAKQSQKANFGNQLIGDSFIAVDIDQDRIIDKISKGNISLADAQEVYDYCLESLERSGKLKEIKNEQKEYHTTIKDYSFVIKCFSCKDDVPFTQFIITYFRENGNKISVYIDKNSDLTLDETLKGNMKLLKAQKLYDKVVKKGITRNKLIIKDGKLVIK